jgi:prepilin-type N-terminal cleavage/methylation domain-containing protein
MDLQNQKGFTLLEVMAVVVIIGILTSTTLHRYERVSEVAEKQSLAVGIRELNIRESLTWVQLKISTAGWPGDDTVYSAVKTYLGENYSWDPAPTKEGGLLRVKSHSAGLARTPSTIGSPAVWK